MSISYSWTFPQFEVAPIEDGLLEIVKTIHWRLDASEGGVTAGVYGTVSLGEPDKSAFTPYSKLTKEWAIKQTSALIDLPQIEADLASQIASKKNPPLAYAIPPFAV